MSNWIGRPPRTGHGGERRARPEHPPYCSCKVCGPVDKWAVYDGKRVFTVDNLSRLTVETRQQRKQLRDGRYWIKWEEVPQEHKEAFLGTKSVKELDIFNAYVADCPFCASAGFLTFERKDASNLLLYFVVCTNWQCACSVKPSFDPKTALERWNRRVVQLRAVVRV